MSRDTIADCLTQIRNGVAAAKPFVLVPYSRIKEQIAHILKEEGYVRDLAVVEDDKKQALKIFLKYVDGESVIHRIDRVSTPGRRIYAGSEAVNPVIGGLGVAILTTHKGVMTSRQAKALGVGGEILCTVW
jgi:small subunit ribosomal protein S8